MENKVSEAKDKVNKLVERGDAIIPQEKQFDWYIMCDKHKYSENSLFIFEESLNIIEKLNEDVESAIKYFRERKYEHNMARNILQIVLNYLPNEIDLIESMLGDSLTESDLAAIEEIREKNNQKKL